MHSSAPFASPLSLSELARGSRARVIALQFRGARDAIAERLHELGFVPGEAVQVLAFGPFGRDPLVVRVGYTRFALRRAEAARVVVELA